MAKYIHRGQAVHSSRNKSLMVLHKSFLLVIMNWKKKKAKRYLQPGITMPRLSSVQRKQIKVFPQSVSQVIQTSHLNFSGESCSVVSDSFVTP